MTAGTLILLVVGLAADDAPPQDAAKQELAKLQGAWSIVSVAIGGRAMVPDERSRQWRAVFEGDTLTATGGGQVPHSSTVRIDPTKTPKVMDHAFRRDGRETMTRGIYKLEGDTLTVCSALRDGERPARFEATEETTLTVLKRADP
jgi:uncharacterized protein (TIGR03067 family)